MLISGVTMAQELQELGQWKVGQAVLVHGGANGYESVTPILRITDGRGGTIYAHAYSVETPFDLNGNQRGGDTWHKYYIQPATDADRTRIRGKNAIYRLSKIVWSQLTPEKAIEIEKLLNDNGIETKAKKSEVTTPTH